MEECKFHEDKMKLVGNGYERRGDNGFGLGFSEFI